MMEELKQVDNKLFINLKGGFEGLNAAAARDVLIGCLEKGHSDLVVDLSSVDSINATGLGVLVSVQQRLDDIGGQLTLCGVSQRIRGLFDRTRLDRMFCIVDGGLNE